MKANNKKKSLFFRACAVFLTPQDLFEITCLNKFFNSYFITTEILNHINLQKLSVILCKKVTIETFQEDFNNYFGIYKQDIAGLSKILSTSKNLIEKTHIKKNLNKWLSKQRGQDWCNEKDKSNSKYPCCYESSKEWCEFDFKLSIKQNKPNQVIFVGTPICKTNDYEGKIKLSLTILDNCNNSRCVENTMAFKNIDIIETNKNPWELLFATEDLTENDSIISLRFIRKDKNSSEEQLGPKFGHCFARIFDFS